MMHINGNNKNITHAEGAARLLLRLRMPLVGIIGVKLERLEDLELEHDLLLGVRNSDGELSASNP